LSRFETETLMRISSSTSTGLSLHPRDTGAGARREAEPPIRAALPALIVQPGLQHGTDHSARVRAQAQFLAQLVAGIEDMPATRLRRRADPETVIDCYRAVAGLAAQPPHARIRQI